MVAGLSKGGLAALSTVAPLMMASPVLPAEAADFTALAAAIFEGSLNTTLRLAAAPAVGWIENWSPAAGVPESTMEMPAAVRGLPAVPLPAGVTMLPLL